MHRLVLAATAAAALALSGCGEVNLREAGENAAWAAFEAGNPEVAQGLRAARTLKEVAAVCGWRDVNASGLAQAAVAGIEDPAVRAAASSLVGDLLTAENPAPPAKETKAAANCTPEHRRALEAQIAAIARGQTDAEGR